MTTAAARRFPYRHRTLAQPRPAWGYPFRDHRTLAELGEGRG